ncbi:MAG: hypothetical protein GXP10_06495, partial [Gammaproteobacteria bacterium]|nr:hypothetical protein [Gammaproteobacteria bacterium]
WWRQRWEKRGESAAASTERLLGDARQWLAELSSPDHKYFPAVWLPLWEASASDELWHSGYQWLKNVPFDARGWSAVWWQLAAWPAPAGPAKELLARAYIRMSSDDLPHARWPRTWLVLWERSQDNKTRRALLLKMARDYLAKTCAGRGRKAVIAIVNEMERRRLNRERLRVEESKNE